MVLGTMMIGAYLAMNDPSGYMVGGLFAFMMLSQRVAQPLVGLARLVEDYEEVGAAIGEAGSVLNRPLESRTRRRSDCGRSSCRRHQLPGRHFHLSGRQDAGARPRELRGPGRHHARDRRAQRLGQVDDHPSAAGHQPRLQRVLEDRRRRICARSTSGICGRASASFCRIISCSAARFATTSSPAARTDARTTPCRRRASPAPRNSSSACRTATRPTSKRVRPTFRAGKSQRLAIARALIHDPRILILDEATSALDPESEAVVNANLQRIARGRTMVIVSHRLSSLTECDQILVMEQGRVVDIGPHPACFERCSIYRQLWAQQNRHLDDQAARAGGSSPAIETFRG